MITAMTFIFILLAVAVLLSADTVRRVISDGQGAQRPPVSHFQDPDFMAPSAR
jgi:tetrahydromethanopterin S-methyltransferase subunit C